MSISDEIRNAYAGVLQSGLTGLALVDAVHKALAAMPQEKFDAVNAACGLTTSDRRSCAEYIATAIETVRTVAPLLGMAL